MNLGISLSLTAPRSAATPFALADVAWSGWWNGDNYNATSGTATGVASAGGSGGRDMTEATNKPTAGNAVNGHPGIIFNGTTKRLNTTALLGDIIGSGAAWTVYAVANIAGYGGSLSQPGYTMPPIISDSGSYWAQGALDSSTGGGGNGKICAYSLTTGGEKTVRVASTTGLHLIEIFFDGTTESLSIDSAAATTLAAPGFNTAGLTGTVRMGANWNQSTLFNGTIYELLTIGSALASGTRTSVRTALATKYGQVWT